MSKLYLKVSPFPVANDPWPNNQHEGVTFKELVVQEAKKDDPAVSTLQSILSIPPDVLNHFFLILLRRLYIFNIFAYHF